MHGDQGRPLDIVATRLTRLVHSSPACLSPCSTSTSRSTLRSAVAGLGATSARRMRLLVVAATTTTSKGFGSCIEKNVSRKPCLHCAVVMRLRAHPDNRLQTQQIRARHCIENVLMITFPSRSAMVEQQQEYRTHKDLAEGLEDGRCLPHQRKGHRVRSKLVPRRRARHDTTQKAPRYFRAVKGG